MARRIVDFLKLRGAPPPRLGARLATLARAAAGAFPIARGPTPALRVNAQRLRYAQGFAGVSLRAQALFAGSLTPLAGRLVRAIGPLAKLARMVTDLNDARDDISASSAGGAPFLIAFGVSLLACAVASFWLARSTAALIVMFQGNLALPVAFWLERRMRQRPMTPGNPLVALSIQLAMSQIVAFPIVIAVFDSNPAGVPLAMASIAGGHFLPYAWLHRSSVYIALGVAVSAGALVLQIAIGSAAFSWILLWMAVCYGVAAPLVYREALSAAKAPSVTKARGWGPAQLKNS